MRKGTYRKGVVHLHEPLELPDNTEVDVAVSPVGVQSQSERERIYALFVAEGLVKPRSHSLAQPSLSPQQEAELAEKLAQVEPLSELVVKEQDGRLSF